MDVRSHQMNDGFQLLPVLIGLLAVNRFLLISFGSRIKANCFHGEKFMAWANAMVSHGVVS